MPSKRTPIQRSGDHPSARPNRPAGRVTTTSTVAVATDSTTKPPRNKKGEYSDVAAARRAMRRRPATPRPSRRMPVRRETFERAGDWARASRLLRRSAGRPRGCRCRRRSVSGRSRNGRARPSREPRLPPTRWSRRPLGDVLLGHRQTVTFLGQWTRSPGWPESPATSRRSGGTAPRWSARWCRTTGRPVGSLSTRRRC